FEGMRRVRVALYREEKAPVIIPGVPQAGAERGGAPEALVRLVVASKQGEHVCARDVRLSQIGVEPQGLLARSQRLGAKARLGFLGDEQPLKQIDVRVGEAGVRLRER